MLKHKILKVGLWALALLIIPLTFQLTVGTGVDGQGFNWTLGDFVFAWVAWFVAGSAYQVLAARTESSDRRMIYGIIVFVVLAIFWIGAATGFEGIIDRFN